jgi:hypothetical protein
LVNLNLSDKHQIFKVNNKKNSNGKEITYFGSVLRDLDINLICANTPQAKGRVERANGILQDRLIKEMRLKNISSIEEGNIFLKEYLQKHNEKFSKYSLCSENAHCPLKEDLTEIFAHKEQRKLSKDLIFQYEGDLYQIKPEIASFGMKHAFVTVINKQGNIEVKYKDKILEYKKYAQVEYQSTVVDKKAIDTWINKKPRRVNKYHPWK